MSKLLVLTGLGFALAGVVLYHYGFPAAGIFCLCSGAVCIWKD
jgi:hypothetical protein